MDFRENEKQEEMFTGFHGSRARLLGAISKLSPPDLSQWHPQQYRPRILRLLFSACTVLFCLFFWFSHSTPHQQSFAPPEVGVLNFNSSTRLPHIPPKIWQIYLSFSPDALDGYSSQIHSWVSHSPSHTYSVLDGQGAVAIISKLAKSPTHEHILPLFYAMSRRVLRADFLRYLLLAIEGGVYSDIDTELVRPIHEWVPEKFKSRTKLIIGLEADSTPPVPGTTYEVQFCQWTLAGAAGHPALWLMVERILAEVQNRPFEEPPKDVDYSDDEVLDITGPAGWTEVIFNYLNTVLEEPITWKNLTGMREPRLYGDVLILPIDGFATGVPHSGASGDTVEASLVRHNFAGEWRGGGG